MAAAEKLNRGGGFGARAHVTQLPALIPSLGGTIMLLGCSELQGGQVEQAGGNGRIGVFVAHRHAGRITRSCADGLTFPYNHWLFRSTDGLNFTVLEPETAMTGSQPLNSLSFGYVPAGAGCGRP